MATITYHNALGDLGELGSIIDGSTPTTTTTTHLVLTDANGNKVTMIGTGLTYAGDAVTGGTITEIDTFNAKGKDLIDITGLSTSAATLYTVFHFGGVAAAVLSVVGGDDLVIGSAKADLLVGGGGADTIKGGLGGDYISGGTGKDVETGAGGADHFVFAAGDGADKITDFTHTGDIASDDLIAVTQAMHDAMTMVQKTGGVLLNFGHHDTLMLVGWHVADINDGDFLLTS